MPVQVTHNNDGHFYTIDVDLAKEGAEVFDLTTYFKARVADNNVGLRFRWFWQGQVFNTVGKKPRVVGLVGQYSFKKADNGINRELIMSPDASPVVFTGDVNDCEPGGYATYYFPEQMFPQDGMFKGTVGLLDDSGETARYTSVDIWFKVYPQAGGAQMGKACDYYISELDKAIKEAVDDLKAGEKEQQKIIDDYRQKVTDLINKINGQATDVQTTLTNLRTTVQALEDKVQKDKLFTQDEADEFKKLIEQTFYAKLNDFEAKMNHKIERLSQDSVNHILRYHSISVSISPNMQLTDNDIAHLQKLNAEATLISMVNITNKTDSNPQLDNDSRINDAISRLKNANIKIDMLKPHLGVNWSDGFYRGDYDPALYSDFFDNWVKILLHYAEICNQNDIPILCIGCEQVKTYQAIHAESWNDIIAKLHTAYPNLLLTAAFNQIEQVPSYNWPANLDFIGTNVYPALSPNFDENNLLQLNDLRANFYYDMQGLPWGARISAIANTYHRPIFVTECGCMPEKDGLVQLSSQFQGQKPYDFHVSALCMEAAFAGWMKDIPSIIGFAWWHVREPFNFYDGDTESEAETIYKKYVGGGLI